MRYDVFVCYAEQDAAWVRVLAGRLHEAGLEVFLDEWSITPGDVLVHRVDEAIRDSAAGILVFSPAAMASPWVRQQYAALLRGDRRFVPVIHREVELPPIASGHVAVDFRHADGPAYDDAVATLIRALRGPALAPFPAGPGFRAEGPRRAVLDMTADRITLTDADRGTSVTAGPAAVPGLRSRLLELDRLRHRPAGPARRDDGPAATQPERPARRESAEAATQPEPPFRRESEEAATQPEPPARRESEDAAPQPEPPVRVALHEAGAALGAAFTPGPVGAALAELTADAHRQRAALRLRLTTDAALADLPWESLIPPGGTVPLGLDPAVQLYRGVPHTGPAPAVAVPGPLRVLVVLASPEGDDGGPLLDVEKELATILDAVEPARRQARAHVRVLNTGTLAAIRDALTAQRFHILHIAGHATAHELLLEDENGGPHRVTADGLVAALPHGRAPAAVVLAGCSTAASAGEAEEAEDAGEAEALPGLARGLLVAGIPQVLAMTAPVTDRYAAVFGGRLYRELALAERPSLVAAVAAARRQVEEDRRSLPPGHPEAALVEWATPALFVTGEPRDLYDPAGAADRLTEPGPPVLAAGVPLRPVGDFVGRRAELRTLGSALRRPGHPGVLVHGIGGAGKSSLAAELLRLLGDRAGLVVSLVGAATADLVLDALGRALHAATFRPGHAGADADRELARFLRTPERPWPERLETALTVLAGRPVTLLLDNFETNLDPRPDGVAAIRDDGLAGSLAAWVRAAGEHRVLITSRFPFALPGAAHRRLAVHHLGPLSRAETRKLVWRLPGIDALTADRQRQAWADVGGHPRTLEYLDALLRGGRTRFADVTERLEARLAANGIDDPGRWIAERGGDRALAEAVTLTVDDTLLDDLVGLLEPAGRDLLVAAAVFREPFDRAALDPGPFRPVLTGLGLLGPAGDGRWLVHRWTAATLARLHPADTARAHARAAAHYRDRAAADPVAALLNLVEARHHEHAAGNLAEAVRLSYAVCTRLQTWAAWDWETTLCRETLSWLPERSPDAATFEQQLGIIAHHRGDYDGAERHYRLALAIREEAGDRAGVAGTRHQLGWLAQNRGDYPAAERFYRESLATLDDLGDRANGARSHHHLGWLAHQRGDYPEAERRYRRALGIFEELGDRAGAATSGHQLGILAQDRGDYDEAERHCRRSLAVAEEFGDRAGVATSHHQLGWLAQVRGDHAEADRRYRLALDLAEELGDRAGVARGLHQLGLLDHLRGDRDEAERHYRRALTMLEEIGDRAGAARALYQLGVLDQDRGRHPEAERGYRRALAIVTELGDRAAMAAGHLQLGALAQARRDHAEAGRAYQRALGIVAELGDPAGIARVLSHQGGLRTAEGFPAEAVPLHVQALVLRLDLRVPEVTLDARELAGLRSRLGPGDFRRAAGTVVGREALDHLDRLLDDLSSEDRAAGR